ncbi:MAG: SLBB domain-containing protein, partial [bacterium]|nr:SLBB domain-containing protein [bacterium]
MIFSLQNLSQNNARTRILRFTVFLLVLSLGAQPVVSYAQSSEKKPDGGLFSGKGGLSNDQMGAMFDVGRVGKSGYDAVIGSGRYIVGPGDTFTILVDSGETPEVFEVLIGAEGKLVLPYIGAVPVAGLSLAQAHEAIRNAIQNRFRQLDIHITLSRLRSFPVNVIGEVQAPGTYLVEGVEQVSELIQKAGGFTAPPEGRASLRNIQILRTGENGQTQTADRKADLALWRLSGDIQHNPFILDGDQIYVPVRTDSFSVSGAVQLPGTYEFVPGDRVWDLIQLGGGLAGNPEISTAKLLRPSRNNMPEKRVPIDLALAQTGDPVANFELQANDKLYIEGKEKHVLLQGEVYFPGAYSIGKGLTLEELIVKAGGFTPQASLAQSSVIRQVEFAGAADRPRQLQNIAPGSLTEAQR